MHVQQMDITCANEKMAEENDEALVSNKEEDETRLYDNN